MKFTLSWLKQHLETTATLDEIVDTMIKVGLEVESVDNPADRLAAFTIGEVLAAEKHPDADKLKVCRVATKDGEQQIVCGAPNARAGIKVAYAPVGAYVPGIDVTLSKAKIRGVESFGMMCSARELEMGDDHDGIIEAPGEAEIGAPVAQIMGLNDPIIDFEVTPNRPDTNGVNGVARDLAAAGLGKLMSPSPKPVAGAKESLIKVDLQLTDETRDACPVFVGRTIRGVKNGPSPKWLQDQLRAIGLRPINALADMTNFIAYDRARPLHVFDADKLKGTVHARLGKSGEKFLALDGKEYEVDETMCVIADDSGVLGLGGIMGGEKTGCTDETVNVFIECAYFDPLRTAKTGRKTGINSDARYRFERGIDPAYIIPGIEQATQMVLDMCGGQASALVVAGEIPALNKKIKFSLDEVSRLTGIKVDAAKGKAILEDLGFKVEVNPAQGDVPWPWTVDVPPWRPDIEGRADLVEEITRIIGLDNLPTATLPPRSAVEMPKITLAQNRRRLARRALAARGLDEAVTWSFTEQSHAALFSSGAQWLTEQGLKLANPISSDLGVMRPSILPNLIAALGRNKDRGAFVAANAQPGLFEVAPIYFGDGPEGQMTVATGARIAAPVRVWRNGQEDIDVYTVKADCLAALSAAGAQVAGLQTTADAPSWFHPGRSGVLRLGPKNVIAEFGEIHPRVLKAMDIDGPIYGFEIALDNIPAGKARPTKTRPALNISELLPLTRDYAFVVDHDTPAETLLKAVRGADKKLIAAVNLFDIYQGQGVPEGKKSLALEVKITPQEKTLTDEDIEALSNRIIAQVKKATGGELRA